LFALQFNEINCFARHAYIPVHLAVKTSQPHEQFAKVQISCQTKTKPCCFFIILPKCLISQKKKYKMQIGILKETKVPVDKRVALTPDAAVKLQKGYILNLKLLLKAVI
jgi:hypothetical protein